MVKLLLQTKRIYLNKEKKIKTNSDGFIRQRTGFIRRRTGFISTADEISQLVDEASPPVDEARLFGVFFIT